MFFGSISVSKTSPPFWSPFIDLASAIIQALKIYPWADLMIGTVGIVCICVPLCNRKKAAVVPFSSWGSLRNSIFHSTGIDCKGFSHIYIYIHVLQTNCLQWVFYKTRNPISQFRSDAAFHHPDIRVTSRRGRLGLIPRSPCNLIKLETAWSQTLLGFTSLTLIFTPLESVFRQPNVSIYLCKWYT